MKSVPHFIICVGFFVAISAGLGGENKAKSQSITGKVVRYQPRTKIVVETGSNHKQEFQVTSDTALKDKAGNLSNHLYLQPGTTVQILAQKHTAESITVSDIAGPGYNPTPKAK